MEMLLCSDAIFLAGSWHEAQKGNTQQGTWLDRLMLLLKSRGVGVQRTMPSQKPAHPAPPGEQRQTGPGSRHRARRGQEELCHICRQGQSEKRSLEEVQHKEQHPGLGISNLLVVLLPVCVVLSWLSWLSLQWFQGRQCTVRPVLKTPCRPTHLYPYYCICFPGTVFGDLFVQVRTGLDSMIFFFTQGLVSLGVELVKNQLHGMKDRDTQWCLLILLTVWIQSCLYFLIFHILYFLLAGLKNHFSPSIIGAFLLQNTGFSHTSFTLHRYSFCYSLYCFDLTECSHH